MQVIINTITSILQALTYFSTSVVVTYTSYQFINYLIRQLKSLINKTKHELINIINQELKLKESFDQKLNESLAQELDDSLSQEINDALDRSMGSISPDTDSPDPNERVYVPEPSPVLKNNFANQHSYQHGLTIGPVTYAPFVSKLGPSDGDFITATGEMGSRMFFSDPNNLNNFAKPETKYDEVERRMRERMDQYSFHVANGNRAPIPTEINFALDGSDTRRKLNESETYRTNIPNLSDRFAASLPDTSSFFNMHNQNHFNHTFKNDDHYIPTYSKMPNLNNNLMHNSMMMTNNMMNNNLNDIGVSTRRISNPSFDLRGDPLTNQMTGLKGNTVVGPWMQSSIQPSV